MNTFSRKDMWYNLFEEEIVHTFLSYSEGFTQVSPVYLQHDPEKVLAVFHFGLYQNHNISSREVYNIFDWLGDIGGIQGLILIISSTISGFFSSTLVPIQKAEMIYKYVPIKKND